MTVYRAAGAAADCGDGLGQRRLIAGGFDNVTRPAGYSAGPLIDIDLITKGVCTREGTGKRDRVFFGAWVTVEDEDGEEATYRIVGPDESDAAAGRISVESPLAKALLGKSKDAEVTVRRPKGDTEVTIVEIRYEDDGAA